MKATNLEQKVTAKPTDRSGSPKRQMSRQQLVQSNTNGSANPQALHGHYDQVGIPRKGVHRVRAALWDSFWRMQSSDRTKDNQARRRGTQDRSASASNR